MTTLILKLTLKILNRTCCCSSFKVSEPVSDSDCQWSQWCGSEKVSSGPNWTPGNCRKHREQLLSIKAQRNMRPRQWRVQKLQSRGHFQMSSAMKLYTHKQTSTHREKDSCFCSDKKTTNQLGALLLRKLLLVTVGTAYHARLRYIPSFYFLQS